MRLGNKKHPFEAGVAIGYLPFIIFMSLLSSEISSKYQQPWITYVFIASAAIVMFGTPNKFYQRVVESKSNGMWSELLLLFLFYFLQSIILIPAYLILKRLLW